MLVFVAAFVAFQVVGGIGVAAVAVPDLLGGGDAAGLADTAGLIAQYPHAVLASNALGQAIGFGVFALLAAYLSTRQVRAFLRLRLPDAPGLGLAALGWAAVYPLVLWLGELNARLPVPQWLQGLDEMRSDMLNALLFGGALSPLFLFVTIAVVPALFEELLFRGYLLRQAERRWGSGAAIVGVGVAFGAYHLSAATLAPLSVLGVYLGFVVWATGSLWAGVFVHLLNNGFAVVASAMAMREPGFDPESAGEIGGPWYVAPALALAGLVALAAVCRALAARRDAAAQGRPDAAPVPLSSAAAPAAVPP